ncbi:hypothetical protein BD410DRAFT_731828 [Rickenella mellea]|uniref:ER transporter 6TM N-terminal domain-containing protein n=1 Tax=Rickenella mellea TaxID=50990 RepID=A0A4Y7PLP4_9AGAM|nr:hypothetical protein BD410DRAFT_731828 [Rickenella mellea]
MEGRRTFKRTVGQTDSYNASYKHRDLGERLADRITAIPIAQNTPITSACGSLKTALQTHRKWICENATTPRLKPVIRCAVAGWISILFLLVSQLEEFMGQAGFLIMIAAFISPPSDSIAATVERELIILAFVSIAFGWNCLAMKVGSIARKAIVSLASTSDIYAGRYIEAVPSIICAVFLCVGSSSLLYFKARKGPGPYLFAAFLGCTCLDISLTVAPLFPYPYYSIALATFVPIAFHSAITIACSILIFPETVNTQFKTRLRSVLIPLVDAFEQQPELLSRSRVAPDFDVQPFTRLLAKSEAALVPLAASVRLINRDVSWGRFGADDLTKLHQTARRLTVRANGMAFFFKIMDPFSENFPSTPGASRAGSPAATPYQSRPPSPSPLHEGTPSSPKYPSSVSSRRRRHQRQHSFPYGRQNFLFHIALNHTQENAVGVFESQKYLNLESRFNHPENDYFADSAMNLLGTCSTDLLKSSADALRHVISWLEKADSNGLIGFQNRTPRESWEEAIQQNENAKMSLERTLRDFREKKRHLVLDLYRPAFESQQSTDAPPHRYLFQCFVYQYHIMQFAGQLCKMIEEIDRIEKIRRHPRLWFPTVSIRKTIFSMKWDRSEDPNEDGDEDPDMIPGIDLDVSEELGAARRRDPDALPPRHRLQAIGILMHYFIVGLGRGNTVFAIKAGVLTALLSLPSFLPNTARFAYVNRFVWAIFMGQLTLSRFRGDTAYELTSRLLATFLGGVVGMVMWYASTGAGQGNAFGLAAVSAVCFPFFFFIRLYAPGPPMSKIIFLFTTQLVVGFSWQDRHIPSLASPGAGYQVAWRRFVLVSAGVTAAFLFSFLPPSTTLRRYIRMTYATTVAEIGQLYCDILSHANAPTYPEVRDIANNLTAIRTKLNRSKILRKHVVYELSLQGRWPTERYDMILKVQLEIAYLLSHLKSVVEHLEPAWAKAFLRRTRFLESDFQGVVLAVISLVSTALRTGTPLPQITPCPLLDRFTSDKNGFNAFRHNAEGDYGLPRSLTIETLENEQYLCFSVGVATAFGIVTRLDKLMVATKELVGEQYHIHGVGRSRPGLPRVPTKG